MTNVLLEEHNRAHAERIAREAAVAGTKSPAEAYALGVADAQRADAASENKAAYLRGVATASGIKAAEPAPEQNKPRIFAKAARRIAALAPAAKAPAAPAAVAAPTVKAPAEKLSPGDIALRARRYIEEQAALGNKVSAAEAVAHVSGQTTPRVLTDAHTKLINW